MSRKTRSKEERAASLLRLQVVLLTVVLLTVVLLATSPLTSSAQVIPVKTVPVASGDQFLLFPSGNPGMGGVSLALPDTLGDPFRNPATASRVRESYFFASPTYYAISDANGSGRTLPLGTLFRTGDWFGGGSLAIQEVVAGTRDQMTRLWMWGPPPPRLLSETSGRNLYAMGLAGKYFPDSRISLGISGFYADLSAMDGVDLLYVMSERIEQSGSFSDLRLGMTKDWADGRALELVLLKGRLRMEHDVHYVDFVGTDPDPAIGPVPRWNRRVETNRDHTDTWGGHVLYRKPLSTPGWTMAWSVTANWKDHPKIPNYEIQNIPRDPGDTRAFAAGIGVSRTEGPGRFAAEVSLEPIRSETWADAARDTTTVDGDVIPAGEKTVENDFHFLNMVIRAGGALDYGMATFRAGVQVRSISYELDQFDRIQQTRRDQREDWMEWTPSLGVSLRLGGADLHYGALLTTGTGRPGVQWDAQRTLALEAASDFLLAPTGPLTLQEAWVTTHQLSVVVPLR